MKEEIKIEILITLLQELQVRNNINEIQKRNYFKNEISSHFQKNSKNFWKYYKDDQNLK